MPAAKTNLKFTRSAVGQVVTVKGKIAFLRRSYRVEMLPLHTGIYDADRVDYLLVEQLLRTVTKSAGGVAPEGARVDAVIAVLQCLKDNGCAR